jgi:hypothetical protein
VENTNTYMYETLPYTSNMKPKKTMAHLQACAKRRETNGTNLNFYRWFSGEKVKGVQIYPQTKNGKR